MGSLLICGRVDVWSHYVGSVGQEGALSRVMKGWVVVGNGSWWSVNLHVQDAVEHLDTTLHNRASTVSVTI